MDDEQQARAQSTRTRLLWAGIIVAALAFLLIVICGYLFEWRWTGLPKRTLWDWLQLLIIPAVLAGGGFWFNRRQREHELRIDTQQRDRERDMAMMLADRSAEDEALRAYLDQMRQLLLDKDKPLLQSKEDGEVRAVARALTLTALARLQDSAKGTAVQFLYESGLITKDTGIVDLEGAKLSYANLKEANLKEANLRLAYLDGAYLGGADLSGASLSGASLNNAYLSGASLNNADLTEVRGWTDDQLRTAYSLDGATMPDGQVLKSDDNLDGPTFEEWLKSQARGEDVENE